MALIEGVDYVVWSKAIVVSAPLTYQALEETYQGTSYGPDEPKELRMAPQTYARVREWFRRYSETHIFNAAQLVLSPMPLPENVIWFAGHGHDGFLFLTD